MDDDLCNLFFGSKVETIWLRREGPLSLKLTSRAWQKNEIGITTWRKNWPGFCCDKLLNISNIPSKTHPPKCSGVEDSTRSLVDFWQAKYSHHFHDKTSNRLAAKISEKNIHFWSPIHRNHQRCGIDAGCCPFQPAGQQVPVNLGCGKRCVADWPRQMLVHYI